MTLSSSSGPAVCPNGHAMDDGLFECPACGAYRPSAHNPQPVVREQCCGIIWEHGAFSAARPCTGCPELHRNRPLIDPPDARRERNLTMSITTNGVAVENHHAFGHRMEGATVRHVAMDRACGEVFNLRLYVEMEDGSKRTYFIAGRGDDKGGFLDLTARDDDWKGLRVVAEEVT